MNKIILSGNVGREPEMRFTPAGRPVADFSLAVSGYKKDDPPTWFKVICWGKTAEFVNQYIVKGSKVLVDGSIGLEEWEGEQGKRSQLAVTASNVEPQTWATKEEPSNEWPED